MIDKNELQIASSQIEAFYTICAMMTKDAIELKLTELMPELYIKYSVLEISLLNMLPDQANPENGIIHIQVTFEKPIDLEIFPLEVFLQNVFSRKIHLVAQNVKETSIKQ